MTPLSFSPMVPADATWEALGLEAYRAGWPHVRHAQGKIMPGGIDEFAIQPLGAAAG